MDEAKPEPHEPRPAAPREPSSQQGREDAAPSYPGSELLRGKTPREVLARIGDGDPLGMQQRVKATLSRRALLLDLGILFGRSLARVAYQALRYRGSPPLEAWLQECIDWSIDLALEDDRRAVGEGAEVDEDDERCRLVADLFGMDLHAARKACWVFNRLPERPRRAFWALSIEGRSLNRYVAEGNGPPQRVRADARRALLAISLMRDPGELPEEDDDHG